MENPLALAACGRIPPTATCAGRGRTLTAPRGESKPLERLWPNLRAAPIWPPETIMNTHLKLSTLVGIAARVENVIGVTFGGTISEMWSECARVAGHCRTRKEAARAIAEGIYNHPVNGDFPNTDERILAVA